MAEKNSKITIRAENIGIKKSDISVEISTRFLEHFSEQLYSSPQKAFEELIANGWDAGADFVDIHIPDDLAADDATITILDNGISMEEEGLRELWHIAFSPKQDQRYQHGRQMVGKFGIGKLSTYVLANRLTYICKAEDSIIRRVTMDYSQIDLLAEPERLVSDLNLEMFEVSNEELRDALKTISSGNETLNIIDGDEKISGGIKEIDEDFGAEGSSLERHHDNTWTLVILSGLKPKAHELKVGILRRMLRAALPLSADMIIRMNGEILTSTKSEVAVSHEWKICDQLGFDELEIDKNDVVSNYSSDDTEEHLEKVPITFSNDPVPHVQLPGIGRVTGVIRLYEDRISGGKSEDIGISNGFFINVLGRIVNQNDSSFGEKNLSHTAWSRFRMTVRADGLDDYLTTNREQFQEHRALKIFRAFLRRVFNKARVAYESDADVEMPDGGDALVKSLGVISLAPLRSAVSETLKSQAPLSGLFDESGIEDRDAKQKDWRKNTNENIRNALDTVKFEKMDDGGFVKFRISDNSILINKSHPFVAEHNRSRAEKELMRTIAIVYLLSDIYALETGIEAEKLENVRDFRDRLMQFRSLGRRQSGTHIAQILLSVQHESEESQKLEIIVGDALSYLGFKVERLGQPGEPEGIAKAFAMTRLLEPTVEEPDKPNYSFTFDAKSSKYEKAKTGNLSLDAVEEHRKKYRANYALVVAPGFQQGAADKRIEDKMITLMRAQDLGRLLELTVEYGAIPIDKLEEVFKLGTSSEVTQWVDRLKDVMATSRTFTIDKFLKALKLLEGQVPDLLHPQIIQLTCRNDLNLPTIKEDDVKALVRGLSIAVPDLIGIDEPTGKIVVNANADKVKEAVEVQLELLQQSLEI